MLKKLFFVALLMAAIVPVKAHVLGDALTLPEFNDGKTHWIFRAGLGINGVVGPNKETTNMQWEDGKWSGAFKAVSGYDFGFGFNKSFGHNPLYWGMELSLGMRGYKTNATKSSSTGAIHTSHGTAGASSNSVSEMSLVCYNAQLTPLSIGYKYSFLERMAVDLHVGAFVSYDFAGNMKTNYTHDVHYFAGNNKHEENDSKVKISDIEGLNKHDIGMNLGVGYWYGHFNIDITWQRGFVPVYSTGDEDVKIGKNTVKRGNLYSNSFQITLGYTF